MTAIGGRIVGSHRPNDSVLHTLTLNLLTTFTLLQPVWSQTITRFTPQTNSFSFTGDLTSFTENVFDYSEQLWALQNEPIPEDTGPLQNGMNFYSRSTPSPMGDASGISQSIQVNTESGPLVDELCFGMVRMP